MGAAVILVGHDMGLMAQFVDRLGIMYAGRLVEVAPIRDIITAPRHPYTRLLIDSLPSLERKGGLRGIPGLAPLLRDLPPGCAFHPRCPMAEARCRVEKPAVRPIGAGRHRGVPSRMTPLLELRDVTKIFTGGVLGRDRQGRAGTLLLRDRSGPAAGSPPWWAKAAAARPRWRGCCWV